MDYVNDLCGWQKPTEQESARCMEALPIPLFADVYKPLKGSGKGKTILLYDFPRKLLGRDLFKVQATVDCTSFGAAYCVDYNKIIDIVLRDQPEIWNGETSTEFTFGVSRHVIENNPKGSLGGAWGVSTARSVAEVGTLVKGVYGDIDLRKYSKKIAEQFGRYGVPEDLIKAAEYHPIETVSLVTTYEQCRDAIANGYPITIASNVGFNTTRDKQGFLTRGSRPWPHQMMLCGVDDDSRRPGVLCQNSWPKGWVNGPIKHDQPEGSFWIDAELLEKSILSEKDSFVYSGFKGFPKKKLNLRFV